MDLRREGCLLLRRFLIRDLVFGVGWSFDLVLVLFLERDVKG